jgi:hypothetical protein
MFLRSGYVTGKVDADIKVNTYKPNLSTTSGVNIIWGTRKDIFKLDDGQLKTDINNIIQNHLPKIFRHIFMMFNLERTSVPMGGIVTESVQKTETEDYIHISVEPLIHTSTGNINYTDSSNTIKRSYKLKTKDIKSQRGRSGNLGTPRSGHSGTPRSGNLGTPRSGHSGTPRSGSRSHTAMVVDTPISVSRPVTPISVSRPHSAMVVDTSSGHRLSVPMFSTLPGDTSDGRSRDTSYGRSGDTSYDRSGDTSYDRSYDRSRDTSYGRSDGRSYGRSGDTSYDRSYGRSYGRSDGRSGYRGDGRSRSPGRG